MSKRCKNCGDKAPYSPQEPSGSSGIVDVEPSEAAVAFVTRCREFSAIYTHIYDTMVLDGLDINGPPGCVEFCGELNTLALKYDAALREAADLAAGAALCDYTAMKEACDKAEAEATHNWLNWKNGLEQINDLEAEVKALKEEVDRLEAVICDLEETVQWGTGCSDD